MKLKELFSEAIPQKLVSVPSFQWPSAAVGEEDLKEDIKDTLVEVMEKVFFPQDGGGTFKYANVTKPGLDAFVDEILETWKNTK